MIDRVKVHITGKNPNYFLKELIRRKINFYNIEKTDKYINIIIDYEDYKDILNIKTIYRIKIIQRYGINKYINYLKVYKIIIIFFLLGILINIILSNLILKIEIIHPNKNIRNIISKDLNKLGLKKYRFKISYKKKEQIKESILNKEKDSIEWLEIEEQGTKYIIKVEEKKKNKKEEVCPSRHIVAKKNAMITRIDAISGEVIKKKNDFVATGDVVISGLIHNKETIVTKRCSEGKIYGEVWYTVKVSIPKVIKKKKLINKNDYGLSIKLLNKEINVLNKLQAYKKTEYNIVDNKIIPIKLSFAKFQKKKEYKEIITSDIACKKALVLATKKISEKLKNDERVISKKVLKKNEFNSKIEVEVFFKVEENITDYLSIEELNIEQMNKKEWFSDRSIIRYNSRGS